MLKKGLLLGALLFLSYSLAFSRATVVLLVGTSCAGKSTLIKEVLKLDPTIKIGYDQDYSYQTEARKFIEKTFPNEYYHICQAIEHHNIFHALKHNEVVFKKNIDQSTKDRAEKALEIIRENLDNPVGPSRKKSKKKYDKHLEQALYNHAITNDCYLIDSWMATTTPSIITEFKKRYNVIIVCLYSPLEHHIERLRKRNNQGLATDNISENRFYRHVINGFRQTYRPTYNKNCAIDILEKNRLIELFDTIIAVLDKERKFPVYVSFSLADYTKDEMLQVKEALLKEFNLIDNESVYICPSYSYDYLINTASKPIHELAQDLLEIIK